MTSWLSKLIIINHKNKYYRLIRQIEILSQIFSAHFYIWIATFDIEANHIKFYPQIGFELFFLVCTILKFFVDFIPQGETEAE